VRAASALVRVLAASQLVLWIGGSTSAGCSRTSATRFSDAAPPAATNDPRAGGAQLSPGSCDVHRMKLMLPKVLPFVSITRRIETCIPPEYACSS